MTILTTSSSDRKAPGTEVILNIGLDGVNERTNSYGHHETRTQVAINAVQAMNFKIISFFTAVSDSEDTVVLRAIHGGDAAACTKWLAERLNQDCIAAWYPQRGVGALHGPRAEKWGEFSPEYFIDMDGGRLSDNLRAAA